MIVCNEIWATKLFEKRILLPVLYTHIWGVKLRKRSTEPVLDSDLEPVVDLSFPA